MVEGSENKGTYEVKSLFLCIVLVLTVVSEKKNGLRDLVSNLQSSNLERSVRSPE